MWDHRLIGVLQPTLSMILEGVGSDQEKLREDWDWGRKWGRDQEGRK